MSDHKTTPSTPSNFIRGVIERDLSNKSFEGKTAWEIQFNDSGRGMDHNSLENLFEPFSSLRTDNLTEIKGSGLGLALVKRLVNMLGATIAITSIENEGTQVMLQMPLS